MAATTIDRTNVNVTDDSGSGTDGTIFNAAWVTAFLDEIDDLLDNTTADPLVVGNLNVEGQLFVNDTANANSAAGLTVNQTTNDDEALTLKSSDVNASTVISEQDTFLGIKKTTGIGGGATIFTASDGNGTSSGCMRLEAYQRNAADTTNTTSSTAIIEFYASQHDGAGAQSDLAAEANHTAWISRNSGSNETIALLEQDGELHLKNATVASLDAEDDMGLVEAAAVALSEADSLTAETGHWTKYHAEDLKRLKILGEDGTMFSLTRLVFLELHALRQLGREIATLKTELKALTA